MENQEGNILYIICVEGAIFKEDRWLIIKRSENEDYAPGIMALVGGKIENAGNEQDIIEATLRREIMEEVGIEVGDLLTYVESKAFVTYKGDPVVGIVLLCEHKSGEAYPASPDEVGEIFWMSTEEVLTKPEIPYWTKDSIRKADKLRKEIYNI